MDYNLSTTIALPVDCSMLLLLHKPQHKQNVPPTSYTSVPLHFTEWLGAFICIQIHFQVF